MKGEESGNVQKVKEILVDCDSDAIIYLVEPSGPACHTGEKVCFHNSLKKIILSFNIRIQVELESCIRYSMSGPRRCSFKISNFNGG